MRLLRLLILAFGGLTTYSTVAEESPSGLINIKNELRGNARNQFYDIKEDGSTVKEAKLSACRDTTFYRYGRAKNGDNAEVGDIVRIRAIPTDYAGTNGDELSSRENCKAFCAETDIECVAANEIYALRDFPDDASPYVRRSSFEYGAMVVPFKYYSSSKEIGGEASIGGYLGYTKGFYNFQPTVFLAAGLTQIKTTEVEMPTGDGTMATMDPLPTVSTDTETGFTWAVGVKLSGVENVGFILAVGQDRIGGSDADDKWDHEGETWVSLSLSYKLQ